MRVRLARFCCRALICAATLAAVLSTQIATAQGPSGPAGDTDSATEIRAFIKTFESGVRLPPALVEGTDLLRQLEAQTLAEHPELSLPERASLPSAGFSSATTARIWGRSWVRPRIELSAGWQVTGVLASDPAFTGALGVGGAVSVTGNEATSPRRLVDFDRVLFEREHAVLQHNLDLLAVRVKLNKGELMVGRQVLSWGAGRFWNPTDLLSPFAPTDIDREVRRGVDAVRYSLPLGDTALLDMLYLPQKAGWAQGGVVRAQANTHGFDVSGSAAKYGADLVIGADASGDLGPLGVHAEVAYTYNLPNLEPDAVQTGERFVRGVTGIDWRPAADWIVTAEYSFNGVGASDPSRYVEALSSDRVRRGEVFGAGRHYAGVSAVWRRTELLSLQGMAIANLADPSALVMPVAEYWAAQHVILRLGGYLPLGARPDLSALRQLTPNDVAMLSPAYRTASQSLGLRSEYGASPAGAFLQLGFYF
jgi:hypothetical protein